MILLIGYRKPVLQAIRDLEIPVVLWSEKTLPVSQQSYLTSLLIAPFPKNGSEIPKEIIEKLSKFSFSAVIASKENSVVLAAKIREFFRISGNSLVSSTYCHDKYQMKLMAEHHQISITPFVLLNRHSDPDQLIEQFGFPIVLKQRNSSGSRGIQFTQNKDALVEHMHANWLAEKMILGPEYSVESFIQDRKIIFSNITEYFQLKFCNIMPADIADTIFKEILALNKKVIEIFHIERGMTHLELYVTKQGLLFGEIALRPPGGYLMNLLELSYGFNPWQAFIKSELGELHSVPHQAQRYSSVLLIHPGEGVVKKIEGFEEIKRQSSVVSAKLRCYVGKKLKERIGVGQDYGEVILKAKSRDEIVNALSIVQDQLKIQLE
ncbi:MAG: ATP-grasp domain-containing protein [Proteobacteria bacterium]|nr:ATP-grasp domain-containing protein [Pseudomonadota bacterium]